MRRRTGKLAVGTLVLWSLAGWGACKKGGGGEGNKGKGAASTKGARSARTAPSISTAARASGPGAPRAARAGVSAAVLQPAVLPSLGSLSGGAAKVVFGVNLAQVRKSVFWPLFKGLPQVRKALADPKYKMLVAACKADPFTVVDELAVVLAGDFVQGKGEPEFGVVVSGHFDENAILSCLKMFLAAADKGAKKVQEASVAGRKGFSFLSDGGKRFFVFPGSKGTVVFAQASLKEKLAAGPCGSSARLKAIKAALPKDATFWTIVGRIPVDATKLEGPFAALRKIRAVDGGYLYVTQKGASYALYAAADLGTPDAAQTVLMVSNMVKPMLQMLTAQKPELAKLTKVLDMLKIKVQGSSVYLTMPIPVEIASALKAMAAQKLAK